MACDLSILFSYWCFTPSSARAMEPVLSQFTAFADEPLGTAGLRP